MLRTVTILTPGEPPRSERWDLPDAPTPPELYAQIAPVLRAQQLERRSVIYGGRRTDMFLDAHAISKGQQVNRTATNISRHELMQHAEIAPRADELPAVHGTVVLFEEPIGA